MDLREFLENTPLNDNQVVVAHPFSQLCICAAVFHGRESYKCVCTCHIDGTGIERICWQVVDNGILGGDDVP